MIFIAPAVAKRKRDVITEDDVAAATEAWRAMRQLKREDLFNPDMVTTIPYPGIRDPGGRPGGKLDVIGIEDFGEFLDFWEEVIPDNGGLILVGGKGVGKSVRLRVFACIQFVKAAARILCIWNMEQAKHDLFGWLKDALHFAYVEEAGVVKEIETIESLDGLRDFINHRKMAHHETFWFILDGAQALDVNMCYQSMQRDAEIRSAPALRLDSFLQGCKVLWGVSPSGHDEEKPHDSVGIVCCEEGLSDRALRTFMGRSLVGGIVRQFEERQVDVRRYAGGHPWFLKILNDCCEAVACDKEWKALRAQGKSVSRAELLEKMKLEDAVELLEDEDDWQAVLVSFEEHRIISSIERDIRKNLKVSQKCHRLSDMTAVDPRYTLSPGKFCTPYIEELYIDVFREKEAAFAKARGGPWVDYCEVVLKEPVTNWAEIGWICERLCTDVVSRLGIRIAPYLDISSLKAERFRSVPNVLKEVPAHGCCIVFFPTKFIFGDIDGALVYRDMAGQLHLVGLQLTTSLDKHVHSADKFMSVQVIDQWIPSALKRVRDGQWKLHFAFICPTSKGEVAKAENVSEHRSGACFGVVPYTLHIRSFEDALAAVLPTKELALLRDIALKREQRYATLAGCLPVPPAPAQPHVVLHLSPTELQNLRRPQLNAIALSAGMNPSEYRNMKLLAAAMQPNGVIVIDKLSVSKSHQTLLKSTC